jgi:GntR family transcriptional regulator, histidine utilization repressor
MTRAKPATLHDRILTDVRDKITGGTWQPGQRIPFETDMAEEYGVSRMTVNKVLTQLTREGYLERRRKVGTFVAKPRQQSAVMTIANIGEEVRQRGGRYSFRIVARAVRAATADDKAHLRSGDARMRVLVVECVHSADDAPFCHEARLINLSAVPEAETADFAAEPAGAWLLKQVPWSGADHTIRAVTPSPRIARLLGLAPSAACLEIERHTDFEDQPITFARLTYRGDQHQLVAQFSPSPVPGP